MKESKFQKELKKELKANLPDCIITKLDANDIQGLPDLLILNKNKWVALECKKDKNAARQPNQDLYINKLNKMSYASFIYPENKEAVLSEVFKILRPRRKACVSKPK